MNLLDALECYVPFNEQEEKDRVIMAQWVRLGQKIYTRENPAAHMTASAWVVSPDRKQVLMAYHNIYHSWAWLGGHADGDDNLLRVAVREVKEESGLREVRVLDPEIFSLEILTVNGHEKRGTYVSGHLHLNVTYLMEADPAEAVHMKPDENSGVAWIPADRISSFSSEPWFCSRIYAKLMAKLREKKI